ncbi:hypothetical protein DFR86_04915 [Acidianus sulfidivorans JP7]|uniref:Uncharacterized protein n=1 Tax=Acidianus sulfidivorans JP7 TaxID=619593 RepID=A0A2U9ILR6_9CREN|nr:hypothetical protein [Acidianus sulfidivorans]AWR96966.1 hypothetical protein DFR86_04915 [Acidianus sulfidivorans JP7]
MTSLNDILLQRIHDKCLNKNKYWDCVSYNIDLLPYSITTKKKIMLNYIKKYLGINAFISGLLSKSIFNCIYSSENETECYMKMYNRIEDLPQLLPDEILIKIHKTIRILLTEKINDIKNLCINGNNIACEILNNELIL